MTLSGQSDWKSRREAARTARAEREAHSASKRPWQLPLIVGLAVVIVVTAIVWYSLL